MNRVLHIILAISIVLCLVEIILLIKQKDYTLKAEDKERYVRWQDYRIQQLSFAINLFLSFAVAALGFTLALVKDSEFIPPVGSGCLLRYSIFSFAASVVFGSLATFTRLWDFRCTVMKIKKKYGDWRQSVAEFLAECLGSVSWSLFYLELATLAYGAVCLIYILFLEYPDKFTG